MLAGGRSATYPAKLETRRWYTLVVKTVGDEMRVTIDGKPACYLRSSGIAHATKSRIEWGAAGAAGNDGYLDDIKVWNAEPVTRYLARHLVQGHRRPADKATAPITSRPGAWRPA